MSATLQTFCVSKPILLTSISILWRTLSPEHRDSMGGDHFRKVNILTHIQEAWLFFTFLLRAFFYFKLNPVFLSKCGQNLWNWFSIEWERCSRQTFNRVQCNPSVRFHKVIVHPLKKLIWPLTGSDWYHKCLKKWRKEPYRGTLFYLHFIWSSLFVFVSY